jgi:hypothetical protein
MMNCLSRRWHRGDEEGIRKSGNQGEGHQESRVSGKDELCGAADRP